MLARLFLAGALGMALVTLSASANAKSVDNGIVERTQSYRIGYGYNASVRLAQNDDRDEDAEDRKREPAKEHKQDRDDDLPAVIARSLKESAERRELATEHKQDRDDDRGRELAKEHKQDRDDDRGRELAKEKDRDDDRGRHKHRSHHHDDD